VATARRNHRGVDPTRVSLGVVPGAGSAFAIWLASLAGRVRFSRPAAVPRGGFDVL